MAQDLLFNHGVLPEDFFKQDLKLFLEVYTFNNDENKITMTKAEVDESGF